MTPYTHHEIQEACQIIGNRQGVSITVHGWGITVRDAAGKRIDPSVHGINERDIYDLADELHVRNNPPAPPPSSGSTGPTNPFDLLNNPLGQTAMNALPANWRGPARAAVRAGGAVWKYLPPAATDAVGSIAGSMGSAVPGFARSAVVDAGAAYGLGPTASMGLAGGAVVGASAAITIDNLKKVRKTGEEIVGHLVEGVQAAFGGVTAAGKAVGGVLIGEALKPFGSTGNSIGSFASTIGNGILNLGSNALQRAGGMAQRAGGLAALGGGVALTGVGALTGALIGNVPGAAIGAVVGSALALIAAKVISVFSKALGSILTAVGEFMGAFGKMVGEGMKALIEVVKDVVNSALEFSRNAMQITQQSGLGLRASAMGIVNGMGFGISQGDTVSALSQNQMFARPLQAAYGIKGETGSADWMRSINEQYQRRLSMAGGNPILASQMLGATGLQAYTGMANLSPEILNRQLNRSQQMQTSFGMKPEDISRTNQNFGMLMASFSQFVELFKTKIAAELLPWLTAGLDQVVKFVSANSGKIADGIKATVQFIVTELPALFAHGGASMMRSAAFLARGLAGILAGISKFTDSLRNMSGKSGFLDTFGIILTVMDLAIGGFRQLGIIVMLMAKSLTDSGKLIMGVATMLNQVIVTLLGSGVSKLLRATGKGKWADAVDDFVKDSTKNMGSNLITQVFSKSNNQSSAHLLRQLTNGSSNPGLADKFNQWRAGLTPQTKPLFGNTPAALLKWADGIDKGPTSLAARTDAWGTDWRKSMTENFDEMNRNIRKMTGVIEKGRDVNLNIMVEEKDDMLARISAEVAEDSWLESNR